MRDYKVPISSTIAQSERSEIEDLARQHGTTLSCMIRILVRVGLDSAEGTLKPYIKEG